MDDFQVLSQREIPALTDLIPAPSSAGITRQEIETAREKLDELGVELPATMGAYDNVKSFLERIFFRKFIKYLDDVTTTVTWFDCHVPPGGKATFTYEESQEKEAGFEFNIFGSEVGHGRSIQLGRKQSSDARLQCFTHYFKVLIKPRVYDIRGKEDVALDIVEVIDTGTLVHDKCLFCGRPPAMIDRFDFRISPGIDRRNDNVITRESQTYELNRDFKISSGVKVPGVPFELKLSGGISDSKKFQVDYEWPPGFRYVPFTRIESPYFQTPMWAIEQ